MFFICRYDLKGHTTTENELRYRRKILLSYFVLLLVHSYPVLLKQLSVKSNIPSAMHTSPSNHLSSSTSFEKNVLITINLLFVFVSCPLKVILVVDSSLVELFNGINVPCQ